MGKERLTLKTDILRQKRNFAWGLTEALPHWWFVVAGIRYDHPDLMRAIASYLPLADQAPALDRSPIDDVAYVVDGCSALRHEVAVGGAASEEAEQAEDEDGGPHAVPSSSASRSPRDSARRAVPTRASS